MDKASSHETHGRKYLKVIPALQRSAPFCRRRTSMGSFLSTILGRLPLSAFPRTPDNHSNVFPGFQATSTASNTPVYDKRLASGIDHLLPPNRRQKFPDAFLLQWIGFLLLFSAGRSCAVDHQRRGAGFQWRCGDPAPSKGWLPRL